MALDLTGKRQSKGYLEAVELVGAKDNHGLLWKCLCHLCGTNYRNVLARDFNSNRVKKCEQCVRPEYQARQVNVVRAIKKKRAAKGAPFRSARPEFRRNWQAILSGFSPRRRLLFEVILDGRHANKEYRFQALDWAESVDDVDWELTQFTRDRVERAVAHLKSSGFTVETRRDESVSQFAAAA